MLKLLVDSSLRITGLMSSCCCGWHHVSWTDVLETATVIGRQAMCRWMWFDWKYLRCFICFITDFTHETNWSRFCHWTLPACWSDGVSVHQSSRDGNEISFMCEFIQLVIIYCSLNEVTVLVPEERFWFLRSSSGLSYSDSSDIKFIKLSPVLVKTSRLLMSRLDLY